MLDPIRGYLQCNTDGLPDDEANVRFSERQSENGVASHRQGIV
jgi:hypothetical protein